MGMGPGSAHQEAVGRDVRWVWNLPDPSLLSKLGWLAGYTDLLPRVHIGGLLMDLYEVGSHDGTRSPAEKQASNIPPVPTRNEAQTVLSTTAKQAAP